MANQVNRLSWMVGGPQGSGVDSSARLFATACANAGLYIFGRREYYSNIKGEHSYFQIRVDEKFIRSPVDAVHLLATYENETIVRHVFANAVVPGGAIIYDPALVTGVQGKIERIPTLDDRVKQDVLAYLAKKGLGDDVDALLQDAKAKGALLVPVPYGEIINELAKEIGEKDVSRLFITKNTIAVGASMGMLHYPFADLESSIETFFAGKPKIVPMNKNAARKGYDFAARYADAFQYDLRRLTGANKPAGKRIFLQGTQAVGMAKIVVGCRFQTYYPITPASDESEFLESHPESGVVVVQHEDEIAAVTSAVGAALTGARTSTSTSGPGFCLMAEGTGWAGINEVPLVIVNYQRSGPSTGLPTRTEQGDLRFAIGAGHSDFPRIVIAPGDIEESFYDTVDAFNWAERYQLPVIVLSDKNLANNSQTIAPFDTTNVRIDRGKTLTDAQVKERNRNGDGRFARFANSEDGISPRPVLGQEAGIHWHTGDEHTALGHITEDPVVRDAMMEKRFRKLDTFEKDTPRDKKVRLYGPERADVTIVSWGSMKGVILDAMDRLAQQGLRVNFVHVKVLSPFPVKEVTELLSGARHRVCVEMNFSGQLKNVVREQTGIACESFLSKYNGRPITEDEIVDGVTKAVNQKISKVVLRHGV
ncbi:MAG TPA: 2-oxoacid:acceptor oxidoreductase subunit alpha [Candidatus Thermoplasmatota archaeon]|nr:2-oxoacid:acceptor oxidoreductase subunit alpha [Candidatus Thermoplasmatota archaeon]